MKIFVFAFGTRGDVQPYVALGLGLSKAGHQVTLCTTENFRPLVEEYALPCETTFDDVMELVHSDAWRSAIDGHLPVWKRARAYAQLSKLAQPMQTRMLEESWQAVEKAQPDLIVYHPKSYGSPHFAEKLGIPTILAVLVPGFVPTSAFPAVGFGFPEWKLGAWYNRGSSWLATKLTSMGVAKYVKAWRQTHGLGKLKRTLDIRKTPDGSPIPVLHGYSGHVMPAPPDFPPHVTVGGYWFLEKPPAWQPEPSLLSFLDAGDPPIYVGFGSMAGPKTEHVSRIVVEALQKAKVRGLLATGWGGLEAKDLPDTIYKLDMAPHDWLFPRVRGVVHHGGAGTTAAGLRAGRPSLVCPFAMDQPFWGRRTHALGVGPPPIPQRELQAETLVDAFRDLVNNPSYRKNAEQIGQKLQKEDSIGNAVKFIEAQCAQKR